MKKRKKILIIGHGRHGKDTVAEIISKYTPLTFSSSSEKAAKIFIYNELKHKYGYSSFEECYKDRHSHRAEWHNLISGYNFSDKARLAKDILKEDDIYVGMRADDEFQECVKQDIFDMVIGVFDPDKPLESKASFNIDMFRVCDYIIVTGDLWKVEKNVEKFCKILED